MLVLNVQCEKCDDTLLAVSLCAAVKDCAKTASDACTVLVLSRLCRCDAFLGKLSEVRLAVPLALQRAREVWQCYSEGEEGRDGGGAYWG